MQTKLRRFIAKVRRTFITDCPRCHKHFYGFHPYKTQVKFERNYRIVCHLCAKAHNLLERKEAV